MRPFDHLRVTVILWPIHKMGGESAEANATKARADGLAKTKHLRRDEESLVAV